MVLRKCAQYLRDSRIFVKMGTSSKREGEVFQFESLPELTDPDIIKTLRNPSTLIGPT